MTVSTATPDDIVLRVDTIDQLFNAPEMNPFSNKEIDVLGEAALTRTWRRLLGRSKRNWTSVRLVIKLPANQMTPDLQQKTAEAVRRYTNARIDDNALSMRLSRRRGLLGLLIVSVISVVVLSLVTLLFAGPLASVDEVVQGFVVSFFAIFAWVMLWDPLSWLLFEWVGPWEQNNVLRRIRAMPIVIEPQNEQD